MAEVKRVLIVDDHYDTLRFLRTMLEMADERFKVTSVLSGEEAGLELRQPYDLLITDVKLPGVDGIQVAERARRLSPAMPVIVMSGFPKEIIRLEEASFDVFRAFRKPLIAEEMLEAVYMAVFGEPPPRPEPEVPEIAEVEMVAGSAAEGLSTAVDKQFDIDPSVPAEIHRRLDLLRSNTGAEELVLATMNGDISAESGFLGASLPAIVQTMANNLRGSFALADLLGHPDGHQSIQYHTTARFDLYTANVGEYHFVTMFFDATKSRRGRIGTVWVFIQRAIKDLEPLLARVKVKKIDKSAADANPEVAQPVSQPQSAAKPNPPVKKMRETFVRAAAIARDAEEREASKPATAPAFYVPPPMVELEPLRDEDMAKLAALDVSDDDTAEAFWDTAVVSADADEPLTSGVTLEEALRQGILPASVAENSPLALLLEQNQDEDQQAASLADNDLAPGHDIPPELLAQADDLSDLTLDLGPLEDGDDFDLSGMPGWGDMMTTSSDAKNNLEELGDKATAHPRQLSHDDMAKLADLEISDTAQSTEVEAFWNALMTGNTASGTRTDGLTFEGALEQGLEIEEQVESKRPAQPIQAKLSELEEALSMDDSEADSFWADVVADTPENAPSAGMTLEEAIRKGLIPSDFSHDTAE